MSDLTMDLVPENAPVAAPATPPSSTAAQRVTLVAIELSGRQWAGVIVSFLIGQFIVLLVLALLAAAVALVGVLASGLLVALAGMLSQ